MTSVLHTAAPVAGAAGHHTDRARRKPPRRARSAGTALLFIAPGLVLFLALIIYPMVKAFQMSLYDWNVVASSASKFTGFDNYVKAYHDPVFWRALVNSAVYMAFTVPPQIVLGLLIAILLNNKAPGRALFGLLF